MDEEVFLVLCSRMNPTNPMELHRFHQLAHFLDNVNCPDPQGMTPLLLLCRDNRNNSLHYCLQILLAQESVDIDAKDPKSGRNALHFISLVNSHRNDLTDIVKLLIADAASTSTRPPNSVQTVSITPSVSKRRETMTIQRRWR